MYEFGGFYLPCHLLSGVSIPSLCWTQRHEVSHTCRLWLNNLSDSKHYPKSRTSAPKRMSTELASYFIRKLARSCYCLFFVHGTT